MRNFITLVESAPALRRIGPSEFILLAEKTEEGWSLSFKMGSLPKGFMKLEPRFQTVAANMNVELSFTKLGDDLAQVHLRAPELKNIMDWILEIRKAIHVDYYE